MSSLLPTWGERELAKNAREGGLLDNSLTLNNDDPAAVAEDDVLLPGSSASEEDNTTRPTNQEPERTEETMADNKPTDVKPENVTLHPIAAAAIALGISNVDQLNAMHAQAVVGREALTSARGDAKLAATAYFGQDKPEQIKAAHEMVDSANSLSHIKMLSETWYNGSPGGQAQRNDNGDAVRTTRSSAPSPKTAGNADADTKPANGGIDYSNVYAAYNGKNR